MANTWFDKRRDFFIRQLVEDFFLLHAAFRKTYLIYLECRHPAPWECADLMDSRAADKRMQLWNRLEEMVGTENEKGSLWRLKDLCHLVWPESDKQDLSGSLVDWLVGSIFHETMKLKENIYLLNRYGPAACRLKNRPVPVVFRLENIIDVRGLISRAAEDVINQMEQVAFLFSHACFVLRSMMAQLAGNPLVIRLLLEQEDLMRDLWGEELDSVFNELYYGGAAEGYCVAGRSYLRGQWYFQALQAYRRALTVDAACDEAVARTVQLEAVIRENRELLGTAPPNVS